MLFRSADGPSAVVRAPAQGAGVLTGAVRDASGAVVQGARVTALFAGSQRKEIALTNKVGEFTLSPLPEGAYTLTVAKPGFALLRHEGIVLSPGQTVRLELVLNVGRIVESMEIKAEGAARPAGAPSATDAAPGAANRAASRTGHLRVRTARARCRRAIAGSTQGD